MDLDKMNANGDGTMLYPSGRTAATVCKSQDGLFTTFMADKDRFQVLATFDADGLGSINYATTGNPWLVTSKSGWMLCSSCGTIEQRGSWPRAARDPIICEVTSSLSITFINQQHITATLNCGSISRQFQCGKSLKKPDSYLDKVVGRDADGHLQLDVAAIRQRINTVGSVFTPPGAHHCVSQQPGLGQLKSLLHKMASNSSLHTTISELDKQQARIEGLSTLSKGAVSNPSGSSIRVRSGRSTMGLSAGVQDGQQQGSNVACLVESPYGSPVLSKAQQNIAVKLEKARAQSAKPVLKRQKLPLISVEQLNSQVLGPNAPSDTLCAVVLLADWNPVCHKLEHYQLQAAWWELQKEAAVAGATAGVSSSIGRCDAAHIKVYKIDGSESRELQQKHDFRTVPMFLFYYQGKLVYAGNSIRTKDDFKEGALQALAAGRRGTFLPDDFSFQGNDMTVLNSITHSMSLLNPSR